MLSNLTNMRISDALARKAKRERKAAKAVKKKAKKAQQAALDDKEEEEARRLREEMEAQQRAKDAQQKAKDVEQRAQQRAKDQRDAEQRAQQRAKDAEQRAKDQRDVEQRAQQKAKEQRAKEDVGKRKVKSDRLKSREAQQSQRRERQKDKKERQKLEKASKEVADLQADVDRQVVVDREKREQSERRLKRKRKERREDTERQRQPQRERERQAPRERQPDREDEFQSALTRRETNQVERFMDRENQFINDFDRTGLSSEEISATRRDRRQQFRDRFYATLTEDQLGEFRENLGTYREETTSEEKFLARQFKKEEQRMVESGEVETLPVAAAARIKSRNRVKEELAAGTDVKVPEVFRRIEPVRSNLLKTIVRPRFQVSRHLDTIVKELEATNPGSIPPLMLAQATRLGETPVTGRTFFPPQNANPTIVYPYTTRFDPPTKPLPSYMNWADSSNVASVRGWRLARSRVSRASRVSSDTSGFIHQVVDQLGCGSCWSISVAGAMSDRVSIWTQEQNPQLSITNILGCVSGDGTEGETVAGASMYAPATAGCAGGIPTGAVEMLANFGDSASGCIGYDWCENDPVCNQTRRLGFSDSPKYLNSVIPSCAEMLDTCLECEGEGECETNTKPRTVWGLKKYESGRPYILLTDPVSIQQELAAHGPVVATYAIYGDFQNGTVAIVGDGWAKTKGVYCNVQSGTKPYSGTRYVGSERQLIGYHAVVIVGWGLEWDVADWENPGSTFDVPYWICRNSWGLQWNPDCNVNGVNMPGYFKIAITDVERGINTKVYLDTADDGLVGAALAFMPEVIRVDPPSTGAPLVDVDPRSHQEKLEVDVTDVKIASLTQTTGFVPDMDELNRDQINHPISCQADTPSDVKKVNCRVGTTTGGSQSSFVKFLPIIVVWIVAVLFVTVVALKLRKRK